MIHERSGPMSSTPHERSSGSGVTSTSMASAPTNWVRSGVERKLEVVGEALNRLSREDPELAAQIPDIARVIGFPNVLAHGYEIVDDEIV